MALIHSLEDEGNLLFRYRGQIPVILFLFAVPVIWYTDVSHISDQSLLLCMAIAIGMSLLGTIIRAITIGTTPKGTSGRNTKEQIAEVLNSTGIYSTVRHPLYLGNYFMWIGIVCFTFNIWYVITVTLAYWLYYERIMFAEERFLEKKFGQDYLEWSLKAPAFFPSFKNYIPSVVPFSLKSVFRREYSGIFATILGFVFVDVLRDSFTAGAFSYVDLHWQILVGSGIVTLSLRSLKHHTSLLTEEGRS